MKVKEVKVSDLKLLKEWTGASVRDCSQALREAQEVADSTAAGTSLGIAIGNLILTIEREKEQERERNLSQLNARIDELSKEVLSLTKEVLTLTKEVYTLRTALMDFSKAVSKRDQELVNAINRKGSYSISSEFTIDFSQFGETY